MSLTKKRLITAGITFVLAAAGASIWPPIGGVVLFISFPIMMVIFISHKCPKCGSNYIEGEYIFSEDMCKQCYENRRDQKDNGQLRNR